MPTRKQFCQGCLAMALAGLGAPLLMGKKGAEVNKEKGKEKVKKIVAKCGLACSECPAYIATQTNDDALRAETAAKWSKMFKADIKPGTSTATAARANRRACSTIAAPARSASAPAPGKPLPAPPAPSTPAKSSTNSWPRCPRPGPCWRSCGKDLKVRRSLFEVVGNVKSRGST